MGAGQEEAENLQVGLHSLSPIILHTVAHGDASQLSVKTMQTKELTCPYLMDPGMNMKPFQFRQTTSCFAPPCSRRGRFSASWAFLPQP
jgi:hypothetical protein